MKNVLKKITRLFSPTPSSALPKREGHRQLCFNQVIKEPGLTAAEIASAVGLERHEPSRRIPELRHSGLVYNGGVRICTIQGIKSMTWLPLFPSTDTPNNQGVSA